jgi:hypothetical protein
MVCVMRGTYPHRSWPCMCWPVSSLGLLPGPRAIVGVVCLGSEHPNLVLRPQHSNCPGPRGSALGCVVWCTCVGRLGVQGRCGLAAQNAAASAAVTVGCVLLPAQPLLLLCTHLGTAGHMWWWHVLGGCSLGALLLRVMLGTCCLGETAARGGDYVARTDLLETHVPLPSRQQGCEVALLRPGRLRHASTVLGFLACGVCVLVLQLHPGCERRRGRQR